MGLLRVAAAVAVWSVTLGSSPPDRLGTATFSLGCFWKARAAFESVPGVRLVVVGRAEAKGRPFRGRRTGPADAVRITFDLDRTNYRRLLRVFWKSHNPWQQGPDVFRSAIYAHSARQLRYAELSYRHQAAKRANENVSSTGGAPPTEIHAVYRSDDSFFTEEKGTEWHCPDEQTPKASGDQGQAAEAPPAPQVAAVRRGQAVYASPDHCSVRVPERYGSGLPYLEDRPECAPPPQPRFTPANLDEMLSATYTLWNVLDAAVAANGGHPPTSHAAMRSSQVGDYLAALAAEVEAGGSVGCDIGFGAGHAAALMLGVSPRVHVVSFQPLRATHADATASVVRTTFPGRWRWFQGKNGMSGLRTYATLAAEERAERKCSFVLVDDAQWRRRVEELGGGIACGALVFVNGDAAVPEGLFSTHAAVPSRVLPGGRGVTGGYVVGRYGSCAGSIPQPAPAPLPGHTPTLGDGVGTPRRPRFVPSTAAQTLASTFTLWNVLDRRLERAIQDKAAYLNEASFGYIRRQQLHDYGRVIQEVPGRDPVYCEIGINAGHGTAAMMNARPDLTVHSFDLHPWSYSDETAEFLSMYYGDRWRYYRGRSESTVVRYADAVEWGLAPACDVVLIDGAHTVENVLQDFAAVARASRCGASVFIDDLDFVRPALDQVIREGLVELTLNASHFPPGDSRNPCLRWMKGFHCIGDGWDDRCRGCFTEWGFAVARFRNTDRCRPARGAPEPPAGKPLDLQQWVEHGKLPEGLRRT